MEMTNNVWEGLRAIAVVHQSDDKDGNGSTAAQLDYLKKDLAARGMRLVDAEILEGVKASAPARINEVLDGLFKRKRDDRDFDVIAWMVEDRASRGGAGHGMWMEHEIARHGLKVYFSGDNGEVGPYKRAVRAFKYDAASEESSGKGCRTAGGAMWAMKLGMFRTGGQTPMGCNRLYCGADDHPKFVIHNLPSGLQEQREWDTGRLIGSYGTVGKKSRNRFKKQRTEYSLLVPGDRNQQQVVRVIFYLKYKKGWCGVRIASYLNRLEVPAPKGGAWSQRQVENIYENEAYTGVTHNNRTFSGRFFRRDREHGFRALNRSETELVLKKTFTPKLRSVEEWERIDQPHMYDFLPKDVRDIAVPTLARLWEDRADPTRPASNKLPRPRAASTFLLTDRLFALQDGKKLSGTLSGPRDRTIPYYRHPKSREELKGSIYNRMIPAKPLHEEMARVLAEVLGDAPDLRERLTRHLIQQRAAAEHDRPDVVELETEREQLKAQIMATVRSLTGAALADAQGELERLGVRRNAVEAALAAARQERVEDTRPVEQVVEEAMKVIAEDRRRLLSLAGGQALLDLVNGLVLESTADLETKDVVLQVGLPTWTLLPPPKPKKRRRKSKKRDSEAAKALCRSLSSWSSTGWQTQQATETLDLKPNALPLLKVLLAEIVCKYLFRRGSRYAGCYQCYRKPRATEPNL